MTKLEERQIKMLKALGDEQITVFEFAKENGLSENIALKTAEHLAKIGALEISQKSITGYGDKFIWANFQTERVLENPKILNTENNVSISDSVLIGNNNSINNSDFSKETNTNSKNSKPAKLNKNSPTRNMQIIGVVVTIVIFVIGFLLKKNGII